MAAAYPKNRTKSKKIVHKTNGNLENATIVLRCVAIVLRALHYTFSFRWASCLLTIPEEVVVIVGEEKLKVVGHSVGGVCSLPSCLPENFDFTGGVNLELF